MLADFARGREAAGGVVEDQHPIVAPAPRPRRGERASFLGGRAFSFAGEAAANSRWNLLPILNAAGMEHPLLGSGLGRTVTYITEDPRLLVDNPTGEYTTFAFDFIMSRTSRGVTSRIRCFASLTRSVPLL